MLLIVEPVGQRREVPESEGRKRYARMLEYSEELRSRGLLTAAQSLRSDERATRLQKRGGITSLVDGPFAEAKEMIGGYFLLTCDNRAEAIAIAEQCPAAQWATVEVREFGPCFA